MPLWWLLCAGFSGCSFSGAHDANMQVSRQASATAHGCTMADAQTFNVQVCLGGVATLSGCTARGAQGVGLSVQNAGSRCTAEDCRFEGSRMNNIQAHDGAAATLSNCYSIGSETGTGVGWLLTTCHADGAVTVNWNVAFRSGCSNTG